MHMELYNLKCEYNDATDLKEALCLKVEESKKKIRVKTQYGSGELKDIIKKIIQNTKNEIVLTSEDIGNADFKRL